MGFFDFIEDGFNWVKNAAGDVYNATAGQVLNPIFDAGKTVVNDTYSGFIKPTIQTAGGIVQTTGRFAQGASQNILDISKGLGNIVSSPIMWVAVIIGAVIIVPKVIDRL